MTPPGTPMLAHEYSKHSHKLRFPVYCQSKLDGLRCVASRFGLFSRLGNRFIACPHIEEALKPVFEANPHLVLDGEIYNHYLRDNFPEICSIVKRTRLTDEVLEKSRRWAQFWIFDLMYPPNEPFVDRLNRLTVLPIWHEPSLFFVSTISCATKEAVDQHYEDQLELGYEGQMVRFNSPYVQKRTSDLLKRKPIEKEVCTIEYVIEGTGKWLGMAGAFVCRHPNGQQFSAALKDTDEMRRRYWLERGHLAGRRAEVVFQYLMPSGVPRHPRLKAILPL